MPSPPENECDSAKPRESLDTRRKALHINLDPATYGSFAEIGAGQEVARWFFRVGGAAGTIAKTMSAYDMAVSDDIYGKAERYVSRQRLRAMLDHEYDLLEARLRAKRGDSSRFFVFADTVTARSYARQDDCHGWLGIRFQTWPKDRPSEIIIHVRLLDRENIQQQEALGIIGVNLIYGALYLHREPERLIGSLRDNLTDARVEVDMVRFSGPDFAKVDSRLMSLQLVEQGLTSAAMFTVDGEVVQAAEVLYRKPILVERGSFRPVTKATVDLIRCALWQFLKESGTRPEEVVVLLEMTLKHLNEGGQIDHQDFLQRADLLQTLGRTVLISNFAEHYKLASFLQRYTQGTVGMAMGLPTLRDLFDEKYYTDLEGGILESFGRLFKNALKLYVYPWKDPASGNVITADSLQVASHLRHLYAHLLENGHIRALEGYDESCLPYYAQQVLAKIRSGDSSWEEMVPAEVAAMIKRRQLFGAGDIRPAANCR